VGTDPFCRKRAERTEYDASMAAYEMYRAGEILATMDGPTEREQLEQMMALDHVARARAHLGDITSVASVIGHTRQGRLDLGEPQQYQLLSA
jgi:multidrug efflux pump subunit AcrA (membrane-fusion protein)